MAFKPTPARTDALFSRENTLADEDAFSSYDAIINISAAVIFRSAVKRNRSWSGII